MGENMKNIAVIFGGKSVEHDISIITGLGVVKNLGEAYNVLPIYISKKGTWTFGKELNNVDYFNKENKKQLKKCFFKPNDNHLYIEGFGKKKYEIDVAVNCLHGLNGEDGTVSGILQISNIPETSSGVCGNAICMDKVLSKLIMKASDIPVAKFEFFDILEFTKSKDNIIKKIKDSFGFPFIIKPARGGSSIGISVAKDEKEFSKMVNKVSKFDNKILVEEYFDNFREINLSVFGFKNEILLSSLEEVVGSSGIFDFDNKYKKKANIKRICPAELPKKIQQQILQLGEKAFKLCECKGLVRIDFFIVGDSVVLNEINTIPGSFAFYLWKNAGLTFGRLLTKLIEDSIERNNTQQNLNFEYTSNVLDGITNKDFNVNK